MAWIDHARAAFGAIDTALARIATDAPSAAASVDDASRLLGLARSGIAHDILAGDGGRMIMSAAAEHVDAGRALLATAPTDAASRLRTARFSIDLLLPYGPL